MPDLQIVAELKATPSLRVNELAALLDVSTESVRRAAETIVLADHGKFDRPSLSVYGPWSANMTLVTDAAPQGELLTAITQAGSPIVVRSRSVRHALRMNAECTEI